jgi:(4-(4-[2-(gamma-L-glutamylamino)ethyl]phenoxymethyl)furan-2-yl)methanamine synthase
MAGDVIGLDIGGANIKAAHSSGVALTESFEFWKSPNLLEERLSNILKRLPRASTLALTMTGELCDCFPSRAAGVISILEVAQVISNGAHVLVWSIEGRFLSPQKAVKRPLQVAAANWLALAHWACEWTALDRLLVIDLGSTTMDIVPCWNGRPMPRARTDQERLASGELVYTGATRTPVCALFTEGIASEFFATMLDVGLVLGDIAEDPSDLGTADGRPATKKAAHNRMAHLLCGDGDTISAGQVRTLAEAARQAQTSKIQNAIEAAIDHVPQSPEGLLCAGSGEFLIEKALRERRHLARIPRISLSRRLGRDISSAACAHAVMNLARRIESNA